MSPRSTALSNSAEIRFAVSMTTRINGASDVSTPLSAISSISPSDSSSNLATRSSARFSSLEDRSTPFASWPSSSITMSQWARLEVAALATPPISRPTEVKPSCTRAMMLLICWAPSPALLARTEASLLAPIRLPTWPSRSRTVSPIRCVAWRVASARLFTSLATTAKPLPAAPARAASMVAFSASRLVCLAMASIDPDILATATSETKFDAADGFDQFGDMLDRCLHRGARLRDFTNGSRSGGLHRPRRRRAIGVGRHPRLGGRLQVSGPRRIGGTPARPLLADSPRHPRVHPQGRRSGSQADRPDVRYPRGWPQSLPILRAAQPALLHSSGVNKFDCWLI